jgi:hypothetical protein
MKKLSSEYSTLVFTGDSPSPAVLRQLNIDNIDGYGNDTGTPFGYLATHPDEDDDTANPSDYQEQDAGSYFPNFLQQLHSVMNMLLKFIIGVGLNLQQQMFYAIETMVRDKVHEMLVYIHIHM